MSNKLDAFFPGTVSDDTFLSQTLCRLATQGIDASTSVACIAACHDMVRQPLLQRIRETWPTTFDYTALAAVPDAGSAVERAALPRLRRLTALRVAGGCCDATRTTAPVSASSAEPAKRSVSASG